MATRSANAMNFAPGLIAGTFLLLAAPCGAQTPALGHPGSSDDRLVPIAAPADDSTLLSCLFASDGQGGKQTLEIRFSTSRQEVEVGPERQTFPAQVTDTLITFRADSPSGVSLYFAIHRQTGLITVSGKYDVLQTGQCRRGTGTSS